MPLATQSVWAEKETRFVLRLSCFVWLNNWISPWRLALLGQIVIGTIKFLSGQAKMSVTPSANAASLRCFKLLLSTTVRTNPDATWRNYLNCESIKICIILSLSRQCCHIATADAKLDAEWRGFFRRSAQRLSIKAEILTAEIVGDGLR